MLQGESDMAYRNKPLGTFQLVGIPPAPRGVPQIEVTFDIDANGIVHVSAKDLGTGQEQQMTITGGTALGKDEIDRMMKDAEAHAEEDRVRREEAEVRNNADSLVFQTEKLLKDQGDKVEPDDKEKIEVALKALKDALAGTDIEAVKRAHEGLVTASQEFAQRLYANAQQAAERGRRGRGRRVRVPPPPTTTRSPTPRSSTTSRVSRARERTRTECPPNDGARRRRGRPTPRRTSPTAEARRRGRPVASSRSCRRARRAASTRSQRVQADFENYRKRVLREQTALVERATEGLVEQLLPVLDSFELRARRASPATRRDGEGAQGRRARHPHAARVGARAGRARARSTPTGAPFDPNEHEAVMQDDGDGEPRRRRRSCAPDTGSRAACCARRW